jgi:hypothetical protein
MFRKLNLLAAISILLITTKCTFYDQGGVITSPNGLSCQTQTDYGIFNQQQSARCYYQCPDGTSKQPEIPGEFSVSAPLYSASKEELDAQFCDELLRPTPTRPSATMSPTSAIAEIDPPTETASPSSTAEISAAEQPPLLAGDVTMCDVAISLINFRMVEPVPDLAGKDLEVRIAGQRTTCAVNPVNTSVLTCTIPPSVTFPAPVVVRLDNAVVNDFTFNGLGCAKISTAFPTTTP